ncbi:hypothetical protein [Halobacillus hunanensis]|uniref:hypothetical protein n=1 Tax=Halobacillus hunanensis TaxID=578214 RepID=UPI001FEA3782|nr:hypothetical protein [Halobacillus hunanensis]
MKKRIGIGIGTALACVIIVCLVYSFSSHQTVQSEQLEERIKHSMEETERENEAIRSFHEDLHKQLQERGLKGSFSSSIGDVFSSKPPSITIKVKNKHYKQKNEKEIKNIIQKLVTSHQLGEVDIRVKVADRRLEEPSEQDKKREKLINELLDIAHETLKEAGDIKVSSISVRVREPKAMTIEIKESEKLYQSVRKDLKKRVHDAIYAKKNIDLTIKVNRKSEEETNQMKWSPIFRSIMEETDKNFEDVTGFAHSFHPKPLQIIIKTSLSNGWFSWGTKDKVKEIETYVEKIIDIKSEELSIKTTPYQLIIRGDEGNKLN